MSEIKTVEVVANKLWYKSKTMYLNLIALALLIVQSAVGVEIIPLEYQTTIVAVLNLAARMITSTNITLK